MAQILVIDDDDRVRQTIVAILESHGYHAIEAHDGESGLKVLGTQAVDLVFCDILMPKKEGLETIRTIRQALPDLPVVAISGGYEWYLECAQSFGANKVLNKPVGRDLVLETVESLLN